MTSEPTDVNKLREMQRQLMDQVPHDMRPEVYQKAVVAKAVVERLLVYLNSLGHKPWRPNPLSEEAQERAMRAFIEASVVLVLDDSTISLWLTDQHIVRPAPRDLISGLGVIEETIEYLSSQTEEKPLAEQLEEYTDILFFYLELGILGDFSWEEVEKEYMRKWKVNIERYERGKRGDYRWDNREKGEL